jgi:hypothetical protein
LNKDKTFNSMMKRLGENTEYMDGPDYDKLRAEYHEDYMKMVQKLTGK